MKLNKMQVVPNLLVDAVSAAGVRHGVDDVRTRDLSYRLHRDDPNWRCLLWRPLHRRVHHIDQPGE